MSNQLHNAKMWQNVLVTEAAQFQLFLSSIQACKFFSFIPRFPKIPQILQKSQRIPSAPKVFQGQPWSRHRHQCSRLERCIQSVQASSAELTLGTTAPNVDLPQAIVLIEHVNMSLSPFLDRLSYLDSKSWKGTYQAYHPRSSSVSIRPSISKYPLVM